MLFKKPRCVCKLCTLHSDGEVAGAAVSSCISSCVLDQSLSYWELRPWRVAAGHCEATTWEKHSITKELVIDIQHI